MVFGGSWTRACAPVALLAGGMLLAGCQSDNAADALDLAPGGQGEKVRQSELRAYCPPVTLHSGTAQYATYERGGQDDPQRLAYQASIIDVTRTCAYTGNMTTVTVAVAGRLVPGPKGRAGTVNLPIRVVMLNSGVVNPENTSTQQYTVQVGDTVGATQFIYTRQVSFPTGTTNIQFLAGYDEGPAPRRR